MRKFLTFTFSASLLAIAACGPQTSLPTKPLEVRTPEQQAQAESYAKTLVPLAYPNITQTDAFTHGLIQQKMNYILTTFAAKNDTNKCIVESGFPQYLARSLEKDLSTANSIAHTATFWSNRYTVVQLKKFNDFFASAPLNKARPTISITQYATTDIGSNERATLDRELRSKSKMSQSELADFQSHMADPDITQFIKNSATDGEAVTDDMVQEAKGHLREQKEKFLNENPLVAVNCAVVAGRT